MQNIDVYGRIESFDQSVRSLNRRLRAVERRLSGEKNAINNFEIEDDLEWRDPAIEDFRTEIQELRSNLQDLVHELAALRSNDLIFLDEVFSEIKQNIQSSNERIDEISSQQIKNDAVSSMTHIAVSNESAIKMLKDEMENTKERLLRQENMNKITIGSLKVPMELSGVIASIALIITGYLVWVDQWDIIRSTYYPTMLAVLFAAAVVIKFVMTNRMPDAS